VKARQKRTAQNWENEKFFGVFSAPGGFSAEVVRARSSKRAPPLEGV
jgi:hypothetical protein